MKPLYSFSLRTLFITLLSLGTLFPFGLIVYSAINLYNHQLSEAYSNVQMVTSEFASYHQRQNVSLEQLARIISTLPAVHNRNVPEAKRILRTLVSVQSTSLMAIHLVDSNGISWASSSSEKEHADVSQRPCFVAATSSGKFSSDQYHPTSEKSGQHFDFAYPLKESSGNIAGAIILTISLSEDFELFQHDFNGETAKIKLIDNRGIILFSSHHADKVGTSENAALFSAMKADPFGSVFEAAKMEGGMEIARISSVSLPFETSPYLYILFSKNKADLLKAIYYQVGIMTASFSAVLLLIATLFWYIGKKGLIDMLEQLRLVAEKLSVWNESISKSEHLSGNELNGLVTVFGDMADKLATTIATAEESDAALKRSEQSYKELVDNAQSIILKMDMCGNVIFFNRFAESFFGYLEKEIIGKNVIGTIVPEEESSGRDLREMIHNLMEHPEQYVRNINENITKTGNRVWVSWSNHKLFNPDGTALGMLSVGQDITAQIALQNEQLRAQKLESLGVLAAGVAHNFNNLLTGIIGYISFARKHLENREMAEKLLSEAERTSNRASVVARQLMNFAKTNPFNKQKHSALELVKASLSLFLTTSKVESRLVAETDEMVLVDSDQISQAFHNIILNAINAMPNGGTFTTNITDTTLSEDNQMMLTAGKYVQFQFRDTGLGIAPEHIDKVFDPYFTTCINGTGLGLSTCHSIITSHGGYIGISSVQNTGTTVTIFLKAV